MIESNVWSKAHGGRTEDKTASAIYILNDPDFLPVKKCLKIEFLN